MQNVKIADDIVLKIRHIIAAEVAIGPVQVPMEDLIVALESLERLATLERHISNLASPAYENKE